MENNKQSSEGKTKNITLGLVIVWAFSLLTGLTGLLFLFTGKFAVASLYILMALLTLPPVTRYVKEKWRFGLSKGLKFIIVVALLIFTGSIMRSDAPDTAKEIATSNPVTVPAPVTIKVSADKLMDDYTANEVAADVKYKNNTVSVSGIVDSIGKDILDTPYIALQTGGQYSISTVQCMFPKSAESALANVSKGQFMTLQGKVTGKLGNIILNGCLIAK